MDVDQAFADELAIMRTLSLYCHRCDDGDFAEMVGLFAGVGAFIFGAEIVTGRDELLTWFQRSQAPALRGKHLTMNVVVDLAGDRARAVSDFVFLRLVDGAPMPALAGRYVDDLVRAGDRWLIERRVAELMQAPSG